MFGWLGIDVVPHLVDALRHDVPSSPGVPLRGRAGLGVAILAGMAAIPNLWNHYLPIIVLALALIGADEIRRWRQGDR